MPDRQSIPKMGLLALLLTTLLTGCWERRTGLTFLGESTNQYYKDVATSIDYPDATQESPEEVLSTAKPRTLRDRSKDEIRELSLAEAITTALSNNRIIRSDAAFLSPGNSIFTNPDRVSSVYDPAIQESGVLFGGRGIEAALSAFDARWDTRMLWGRNSTYNNSASGTATSLETANFNTSLTKAFGYGGQVQFSHNVDYLGTNNVSSVGYPSAYTGSLLAEYRQPLLAGSGTEFTQIAGPITQSFGGITGVSQGVVIARINNDITIADLEANLRNLVLDVELLYWDLYLAYVQYDTAVQARDSALKTWSDQKNILDIENMEFNKDSSQISPENAIQQTSLQGFGAGQTEGAYGAEAQARDAYYQARAATEQALAQIYSTETRLRRLLGLPVNDGEILRPSDEPLSGEYVPDWYAALADALTNRVELRRQKWNVKSLELQLQAAKSLTRPRLDFVTNAQINGLGDDLIGDERGPAGTDNLYGTFAGGDTTGWGAGVEMSIPIGYRSALAQVRNVELRLAKARELLSVQEMEISQEVAASFQDLASTYQNTQTLYNRRYAAEQLVAQRRVRRGEGDVTTDFVLRAIASRADAENAYYLSLVEYNKALAQFQFRKGTLLEYNNIFLAEGQWDQAAYQDALRRAKERGHAFEDNLIESDPRPFSMGPVNPHEVHFHSPAGHSKLPPMPEENTKLPPQPSEPVPSPPADDAKPYDQPSASINMRRKTHTLNSIPDSKQLLTREKPTLAPVNRLYAEQQDLKNHPFQSVKHEVSVPLVPQAPVAPAQTPGVELMPIIFDEEPTEPETTVNPPAIPQPGTEVLSPAARTEIPQWPNAPLKTKPAPDTPAQQPTLPFKQSHPRAEETSNEPWHPLNLKK